MSQNTTEHLNEISMRLAMAHALLSHLAAYPPDNENGELTDALYGVVAVLDHVSAAVKSAHPSNGEVMRAV
jgi:hypothetical protein